MIDQSQWQQRLEEAQRELDACPAKAVRLLQNSPDQLGGSLKADIENTLRVALDFAAQQRQQQEHIAHEMFSDAAKNEGELLEFLQALMNNDCFYVGDDDKPAEMRDWQQTLANKASWPDWRIVRLFPVNQYLLNNLKRYQERQAIDRLRAQRAVIEEAKGRVSQTHSRYANIITLYDQVDAALNDMSQRGVYRDSRGLHRDYVGLIEFAEQRIRDGFEVEEVINQAGGKETINYPERLKQYHLEYAQYVRGVANDNFTQAVDKNVSQHGWVNENDKRFSTALSLDTIEDRLCSAVANLEPGKAAELGITFKERRLDSPRFDQLPEGEETLFKTAVQAANDALTLLQSRVIPAWNTDARRLGVVYENVLPFYKHPDVLRWIVRVEDDEVERIEAQLHILANRDATDLSPTEINDLREAIDKSAFNVPFAPNEKNQKVKAWRATLNGLQAVQSAAASRGREMDALIQQLEERLSSVDANSSDQKRREVERLVVEVEELSRGENARYYNRFQIKRIAELSGRYNSLVGEGERFSKLARSYQQNALSRPDRADSWEPLVTVGEGHYESNNNDDTDFLRGRAIWLLARAATAYYKSKTTPDTTMDEDQRTPLAEALLQNAAQDIQTALNIWDQHMGVLPANYLERPRSNTWDNLWESYTMAYSEQLYADVTQSYNALQDRLGTLNRLSDYLKSRDEQTANSLPFYERNYIGYIESIDSAIDQGAIYPEDREILVYDPKWLQDWKTAVEDELKRILPQGILKADSTLATTVSEEIELLDDSIQRLEYEKYPVSRLLVDRFFQLSAQPKVRRYEDKHFIASHTSQHADGGGYRTNAQNWRNDHPFGLVHSMAEYDNWLRLLTYIRQQRIPRYDVASYALLANLAAKYNPGESGTFEKYNRELEEHIFNSSDVLYNSIRVRKELLIDAALHILTKRLQISIQEAKTAQILDIFEQAQVYQTRLTRLAQDADITSLASIWHGRFKAYRTYYDTHYALSVTEFDQIQQINASANSTSPDWLQYRYQDTIYLRDGIRNQIKAILNKQLIAYTEGTGTAESKVNFLVNVLVMFKIDAQPVGNVARDQYTRIVRDVLSSVIAILDYLTDEHKRILEQTLPRQMVDALESIQVLESRVLIITSNINKSVINDADILATYGQQATKFTQLLKHIRETERLIQTLQDQYDDAVKKLYNILNDQPFNLGNLWEMNNFYALFSTVEATYAKIFVNLQSTTTPPLQNQIQYLKEEAAKIRSQITLFTDHRAELQELLGNPPTTGDTNPVSTYQKAQRCLTAIFNIKVQLQQQINTLLSDGIFMGFDAITFHIPDRFLISPLADLVSFGPNQNYPLLRGMNEHQTVLQQLNDTAVQWQDWMNILKEQYRTLETLRTDLGEWVSYMSDLNKRVYQCDDPTQLPDANQLVAYDDNLTSYTRSVSIPKSTPYEKIPEILLTSTHISPEIQSHIASAPAEQGPPIYLETWIEEELRRGVHHTDTGRSLSQGGWPRLKNRILHEVAELDATHQVVATTFSHYQGYIAEYTSIINNKDQEKRQARGFWGPDVARQKELQDEIDRYQANLNKLCAV
jgi:hypothetical protein